MTETSPQPLSLVHTDNHNLVCNHVPSNHPGQVGWYVCLPRRLAETIL